MHKEEVFDLVNKYDEVIGTATREKCHSNPNLIHHTIHFTLIDRKKKKILLTQRSLQKDHDAGKYCFLGEHLFTEESYPDGVKRGVQEELGFIPKNFSELSHNIFTYQTQTEFVRFFIVNWDGEKIECHKKEMEKILWVDIDKLVNATFDFSEMTKYWINNINWKIFL